MTRAERAKRTVESKAPYVSSVPDELMGPYSWNFASDIRGCDSYPDNHEVTEGQDHETIANEINLLIDTVRQLSGHVAFLEAYVADLEEELTGQDEVVSSVVLPTLYDLSPGSIS